MFIHYLKTALITLRSRAIESQKTKPLLVDPVGEELFKKVSEALPGDLGRRILERKVSPVLTSHIAIRARKFDTRFWRLGGKDLKYMELDLPAVIQAKQQLLGERITYKMMADSVLKGAGTSAGDYYQFGMKEAGELESFHPGIKVKGDWSYFEDPDIN